MKNLKLIFIEEDCYCLDTDCSDIDIKCKTIDQLTPCQKEDLAKMIIDNLNDGQKVNLLKSMNIEQKKMNTFVKSLGYDFISRVEKIPEIEIDNSNNIYYRASGNHGYTYIDFFDLSNKDFRQDKAASYNGPFFLKVNLPDSHPFRKHQIDVNKKQDEIKKKRAEKAKLAKIKRAKKLLEENL